MFPRDDRGSGVFRMPRLRVRAGRSAVAVLAAAVLAAQLVVPTVMRPLPVAAAGSGYASTVLADHPVIYYRLGEAPGTTTAADTSGNGHSAVYNSTAVLGKPGAIVGDSDTAAYGTQWLAQYAAGTGLPTANSSWTIEEWVNTTNSRGTGLTWGNQATDQAAAVGAINGGISVSAFNDDHLMATPYPTNDGNWHHVVGTYNGSLVRVYLDGVNLPNAPQFAGPLNIVIGPAGLVVGGCLNQNCGDTGTMDEVAIYNYALSATQIATHYVASGQVRPPQGGAPPATESAPPNPASSASCAQGQAAHPVNCATGTFYENDTDLVVPGRGIPLSFIRSYSTASASVSGPLGFGWTFNSGARLLLNTPSTGSITVSQENGSQVVFNLQGSTYAPAAPRMIATLVHNGDGTYTYTRRAREHMTFSSSGQLLTESDINGYTTTLGYASGNLTSLTDSASRQLTIGYTGSLITSVSDPTGRKAQFAYNDGAGNLTDVTDVNGGLWHYTYTNHLITQIKDPRGTTTTNTFDSSNRVIQQSQDQLTRITKFSYTGDNLSAAGGTTTITDPNNNLTVEQYQYGEQVAKTVGSGSPVAATWQYRYDPMTMSLTTVVDPNGHVTTHTYDASGNLLTTTDALNRTTTYTYNCPSTPCLDEPATVTDPNNVTTTLKYDGNGNLLSRSTPLVGANPPQNQVTTYTYGDPSHPGDVTAITDPNSKVWSRGYDTDGDLVETKDPLGNVAASVYNTIGWVTSTYSPKAGCTWGAIPPAGCSSTYQTSYSYADPSTGAVDEFGDVRVITDPLGHKITKTYDADRNLTDMSDGDQHIVHTVFDAANEATSVTRGYGTSLASTSITDYWPDGTVQDQKDGNQNVTSYAYDAQARLTSVTTPTTTACPAPCKTVYGYDAAGNRISKQDPAGTGPPTPICAATPPVGCTTFAYDAANELTSITYSDGTTPNVSSISYDADGQRTGMTDGTGAGPWVWKWDSLHRMRSSTDSFGRTVLYGYDLKSQRTTITYPSQSTPVTRLYDDAGRLKTVTDWLGNTTTFSPDANSNLGGETYPNTAATDTLTFDAADRLMGVTDTTTSGTFSLGYGRDNANQLNAVTGTGLPDTHAYGYTPLNQVSQVDTAGSYLYDKADNPTAFFDATAQTFDAADEVQTAGRIALAGTGGAEAAATSSSPLTVTFATTQGPVQANDQIIVAVTIPGNRSMQTPSGYTVVASASSSNGALGAQTIVYRTKAVGGEAGVTLTQMGNLPFEKTAVAAIYRGVDTVTPVDASATNTAPTATSVSAGPVTASIPGERLVMAEGATGNATAANWAAPAASGTTMTDEAHESDMALSATALADGFLPTAVSSSATATFGTSANLVGILLALKPATTAYSYDARGNRISATPPLSSATTLAYDQADRLTAYGSAATYAYNADGLRISKTVGGTTEQFTYDQAEGLPLILQDGPTQFIYGAGGQPLEAVTPQPAISVVGTASGGNPATTTSQTAKVTLPTGIQANDQIILGVTFPAGLNNSISSVPAGFTKVGQSVKSGGTAADVLAVYQKTASASDSGATESVQFSGLFASGLVAAVYRGVDPTTPVDLTSPGSTNGGGTVTPAAVTTRYSGEEWVVVQGATYVGTSPESWSAPTGMHEETPQANANATVSAGLADVAATAPGTTGTLTSTFPVSGQLTTMFIGLKTPPQVTYFHQDQLGSTRLLTDQAGQVVATFTFDAYGRPSTQTGSATTPFLYAGQYRDAESGFYYLRARYYDPATAQFLSRDPLAAVTGHPYAYVSGNPLNRTDPSGLIDKNDLSPSQINQINGQCSGWQNQSMCLQAAFCTGDNCHTIGQIAVDDYNEVEGAISAAGCSDSVNINGYHTTIAIAQRDLAEMRAAFNVVSTEISYENGLPINALAAIPADPGEPLIVRAIGCVGDTGTGMAAMIAGPMLAGAGVAAAVPSRGGSLAAVPLGAGMTVGGVQLVRLGVGECGG